jgi:hypothetical protein
MKVKELHGEDNTGILASCSGFAIEKNGNSQVRKQVQFNWIEIKRGRYINDSTSHPLRSGNDKFYKRISR